MEYMQEFPLCELTLVREKAEKDWVISGLPAQKHFGNEGKLTNRVKQGNKKATKHVAQKSASHFFPSPYKRAQLTQ